MIVFDLLFLFINARMIMIKHDAEEYGTDYIN